MQGIEFVVAAYVLTWAVLAVYAGYVWRRFRRAERALRDDGTSTRMGGAA